MKNKNLILVFLFLVLFMLGCKTPYEQMQNKLDVIEAEEPTEIVVEESKIETKKETEIENIDVYIEENQFNPETISIKKGTKVTWINKDTNPHKIACYLNSDRLFTGNHISPGNIDEYIFVNQGEYTCIDAIYGLKGYVDVGLTLVEEKITDEKEETIIISKNIGEINPVGRIRNKDITNVSAHPDSQKETIFTLTETEYQNLELAEIRFIPTCPFSSVENGELIILVNSYEIFGAIPICNDRYKQDILKEMLSAGENTLLFKTVKGFYIIGSIELSFTETDTPKFDVSFDLDDDAIQKDLTLHITFSDEVYTKRADLFINGQLIRIDQKDKDFSLNIGELVKRGDNIITIKPKTTLNIEELKVVY